MENYSHCTKTYKHCDPGDPIPTALDNMLGELNLTEHVHNVKKVSFPSKTFENCVTLFHCVPEIGCLLMSHKMLMSDLLHTPSFEVLSSPSSLQLKEF